MSVTATNWPNRLREPAHVDRCQRPRRPLQARLRQPDARHGPRAIELGLQARDLRVEHVGARRDAGAIALADDPLGLGRGADSSSAAATAARLDSSSSARAPDLEGDLPVEVLDARLERRGGRGALRRTRRRARPPSQSDQVTLTLASHDVFQSSLRGKDPRVGPRVVDAAADDDLRLRARPSRQPRAGRPIRRGPRAPGAPAAP